MFLLTTKLGKIITLTGIMTSAIAGGSIHFTSNKDVIKQYGFNKKKRSLDHKNDLSLLAKNNQQQDNKDLKIVEHSSISGLENKDSYSVYSLPIKNNDDYKQTEENKNSLKITNEVMDKESSSSFWTVISKYSINYKEFEQEFDKNKQDLMFLSVLSIKFNKNSTTHPEIVKSLGDKNILVNNVFKLKDFLDFKRKNLDIVDIDLPYAEEKITISLKMVLSKDKTKIEFYILLKKLDKENEKGSGYINAVSDVENLFYFLVPKTETKQQDITESVDILKPEEGKQEEVEEAIIKEKETIGLQDIFVKDLKSLEVEPVYLNKIVLSKELYDQNTTSVENGSESSTTKTSGDELTYQFIKQTSSVTNSVCQDPKKVGGILKTDPKKEISSVTRTTPCTDDNTSFYKVSKSDITSTHDTYEETNKPATDFIYRFGHQNCTTSSDCLHQNYTEATPCAKLNQSVAELIDNYQKQQNTSTITYYDVHKKHWTIPTLLPVFQQRIVKDKTKQNENVATSSTTQTKSEPIVFVEQSNFRAWGNKKQTYDNENLKVNAKYSEEYEKTLVSNHNFGLIIKQSEIKKHIIDKYEGETNTTSFGISLNLPLTLSIQDLADNFTFIDQIPIKEDIFFNEILLSSKIKKKIGNFDLSSLIPEGIGEEKWCNQTKKTELKGEYSFFLTAEFNQQGDLIINFEIESVGLVNTRNAGCDSRDWDVENYKCKQVQYLCPKYKKIPTLLALSFDEGTKLSLFKYQKQEEVTTKQTEQLKTENIKSREISQIINIPPKDRQRKHFQNVTSVEVVAKKGEKDNSFAREANTGWFSSSNYLTIFGKEPSTKDASKDKTSQYTTFDLNITDGTNNESSLVFNVAGLDSESSRLLFNSKDPLTTHQTLFISNEYIKPQEGTTTEESTPDEAKYNQTLKNKTIFELAYFDFNQDVKIKLSDISTSKDKPTTIPFRFFVSLKKTEKYDTKKDEIKKLVKYVKSKVFTNNYPTSSSSSSATEDISDWTKDSGNKLSKSTALAFGSMNIDVYKTTEKSKTQIFFKTSLWGGAYSKDKKSNSKNAEQEGAEGSVGFEIMNVVYNNKDIKKVASKKQ